MEVDINLGVAKAIVANKITNEFVNESKIGNSKKLMADLINVIKKSPVLMKEYYVINNIENKFIENDITASKFIDHNIGTFSKFSTNDINEAHKSLKKFINESEIKNISESKHKLYNSISVLIKESNNSDGDINKLHDAYENVLTYLKENIKEKEIESSIQLDENINLDDLISIATKKFNKKYSVLKEEEKKLVNTLVYGSFDDKKTIFEGLKEENISSLKSINSNGVEDKINEAIDKLNKMTYSEDSIVNNIIELKNLKENLS